MRVINITLFRIHKRNVVSVPRTLRPVVLFYKNESLKFQDEIEDYISPTKSITYMIHSQNIDKQKMTITVSTFKKIQCLLFLIYEINLLKHLCVFYNFVFYVYNGFINIFY